MGVFAAGAIAVQVGWLALSLYQSGITLFGRIVQAARRPPAPGRGVRFGLLVCARNEERVVAGIVGDLQGQDYPADQVTILVAAHNCSDNTAAVAEQAGVAVVETRTDRPGKAHPMRAGLQAFGEAVDLIGVFDADTLVPEGLLAAVAAAAEGEDCIQVETLPRSAGGPIAAGYGLGRRARNVFWWRPREALGLGTTVSGSGFFIRPSVLREVIEGERTLTEDLEISMRLYAAGRRVRYLSAAHVWVEEPAELRASLRQRSRWARGHFGVIRYELPGLVRQVLRGNLRALDMAVYLVAPSRVLTRTLVTATLGLAFLAPPLAPPLPLVGVAIAGEWLLPLGIGLRDRLLPLNASGLAMAGRVGLLNLLWFPIGLWSLATAGRTVWHAQERLAAGEAEKAVPVA
ncbi:MAG: glycosyltransferase [Dehalococcoidia bacterium]|nr:glycosyltransferase [Dehalococcoidia bacterium]